MITIFERAPLVAGAIALAACGGSTAGPAESNSDAIIGGSPDRRTVKTTLRKQEGDMLLIGNTGKQACNGHSGGPAIMTIDGVDTIVGTDDLAATDRNCKDGDCTCGWIGTSTSSRNTSDATVRSM